MEKTDSALAAGFSSVVVIMFALHAKVLGSKLSRNSCFLLKNCMNLCAVSCLKNALPLCAFTKHAPKDFCLLPEDRFP